MFGEGISRSSEILDMACDYDIIQKSGSWFSYDGSKLAQGREAARNVISDNPELADELEAKIMEAIKANPDKKRSSRTPKFKRADSSAAKDNDAPADEPTDADSMPDTELPDEFSIEEDA